MINPTTSHRTMTFWIITCAALGGILYGYDIGVISGALLIIKKTIPMNDYELGMIVGAVLGGGLIGNIVTGSLADRYGRRTLILTACYIFILGIICILFANNFIELLISRLILGVGVGVVSVAVPLYLSEMSPAAMRGRSITAFQLFLTFGIVLAYVVDLLFTPSASWHAMFAVILIPAIILLVGMQLSPETPRWLLANQQQAEATRVLKLTRPADEVDTEYQEITASLQHEEGGWRELFSASLVLPLSIALLIAIFNQLTGINSIFQYAPIVLQKAGFGTSSVEMLGTIGLGAVNFVTTIISLCLIDYLGRRFLLRLGTGGIIVSAVFLALIPHFGLTASQASTVSLIALLVYVFSFAIGPGVVVWLVISELLPTKVRGKGVALCLFVNSLASTILATVFLHLLKLIGMSGAYWLFAGLTVPYFLIATYMLPETKHKSLEAIHHYFQSKFHAVAQETVPELVDG